MSSVYKNVVIIGHMIPLSYRIGPLELYSIRILLAAKGSASEVFFFWLRPEQLDRVVPSELKILHLVFKSVTLDKRVRVVLIQNAGG